MSNTLDLKLRKIIEGQLQYKSEQLGLNLLISRLQKKNAAAGSPQVMNECIMEFNAFIEKYKSITVKDISAIERL